MTRRQQWQEVLQAEMQRWSALTYDQLLALLRTTTAYQIERGSRTFQVEIEALENTPEYVHVAISVDDGSVPASFVPVTQSFVTTRPGRSA